MPDPVHHRRLGAGQPHRAGRHEATTASPQDVQRDFLADPAEFREQIDYLARAISEDSPTARRLVDTSSTKPNR